MEIIGSECFVLQKILVEGWNNPKLRHLLLHNPNSAELTESSTTHFVLSFGCIDPLNLGVPHVDDLLRRSFHMYLISRRSVILNRFSASRRMCASLLMAISAGAPLARPKDGHPASWGNMNPSIINRRLLSSF